MRLLLGLSWRSPRKTPKKEWFTAGKRTFEEGEKKKGVRMLGVVYAVATVRSAPFFLSFFSFYYTSLRSVLLLFAGHFSTAYN